MSQQAAREAAARAFDANPCKDTADALNGACYGTEDWWTPEGHPIRNAFRCCALWVAHVRALGTQPAPTPSTEAVVDPALFGPPILRLSEHVDDFMGFPRVRRPGRNPRIEIDGKRGGGCRVRFSVMGRPKEIVVFAKDHDREPLSCEESLRYIIRGELEAREVCPTEFEIIPGVR